MKNIKGFTLIELLVTISILGIIMGISIPLIRNLQEKNKNRKYDMYGESMLNSAKLYQDSYSDDLFGYRKSGCAIVTLQDLIDKNLIKDYAEDNISCNTMNSNLNSEKSLVKIVKMGKRYGYSYQLFCGKKGEDNTPINPKLMASSDSERVKNYSKTNEETNSTDFDNDICNSQGIPNIKVTPASGVEGKEKYKVKIELTSSTGITTSPALFDIEYTWLSMNSKNEPVGDDFDYITNWKKLNFTIPSKEKQEEKILSNTPLPITASLTKNVPKDLGWYWLIIRINKFSDLYGSPMEETSHITKAGVYTIAKIYHLKYDPNGGSACPNNNELTVINEKGHNNTWGVLCRPTKEGYDFKGWKDSNGNSFVDNTPATSDVNLKANWQIKSYTLTYDSKGGTACSSKTVTHGSKWGPLCTPTRTGYRFTGWKSGSRTITNDTVATSNLNVEAQWTPYVCTITYSPNGGIFTKNSSQTTESVSYGNYVGSEQNGMRDAKGGYYSAERDWYHIDSDSAWKNGTRTFDENSRYLAQDICDISTSDNSVTLNVNWQKNIATIKYHLNGGTLKAEWEAACPVTIGSTCTPTTCKRTTDKNVCQGRKTGLVAIAHVSFDNDVYDTEGLRDYSDKPGSTIGSTRTGYSPTKYWLYGSTSSSIKIHQDTPFAEVRNIASAIGRYDNLKAGNDTWDFYAEWTRNS